jgi:hypothetical protein
MAAMPGTIQQKCPYCDETLTFEITAADLSRKDEGGYSTATIKAQTTPESTAHVWTHAPDGASKQ